MRRAARMALAAAAMLGAGSGAARADLLLENKTGQSVQHTIYDGSGQPLPGAAGCMRNDAVIPFTGTDYARGRGLYIRGILKSRSDCTGSNLSDTGRGSRQLMQESRNTRKFITFTGRLLLQ